MAPDDLHDLAGSVLDGTPVDWARAEAEAVAASRDVIRHLRVLEGVGWNVSHAARRLGVHRNTVLTKLSAWRIQRPGSEGRSLGL